MRIGIRAGQNPVKKSFEYTVSRVIKAVGAMEKANGKVLVSITDKNGHKTRRWMNPEEIKQMKAKKAPEQNSGKEKPQRTKKIKGFSIGDTVTGTSVFKQKVTGNIIDVWPGQDRVTITYGNGSETQCNISDITKIESTGEKTEGPSKRIGIRVDRKETKNKDRNQFAGSVAVGDFITGKDAVGNDLSGKVTAKGRDGLTVLTDAGTIHHLEWGGVESVDQPVNDHDAIRMIYDKEAIEPSWRNGDDGNQPESCDTIEGLLKAAAEAREDFNKLSAGYAKRFRSLEPILIKRPVLKGIERIKEKLRDDYEKGDKEVYEPGPPEVYHARSIRDTDGHTLALKNVADVGKMLAALEKDKNVIRIKNNFAKPSSLGYSDINANIRLPNGTIAEIQLNTTANLVAKERYGHSLYELYRSIKGDKDYQELADIMTDAQKALYELSNQDSKSGTYKLSEEVNEAIINGDTGALFKEEHEEYADAIRPFVEKAIPLFNGAVEAGKIGGKTADHFKDLVRRLQNRVDKS